jgi:hypothetical protein
MLRSELEDAIRAFELAVKSNKGMRMTQAHKTIMKGGCLVVQDDVLTTHRIEQINRILRWAHHHWYEFETELHEFTRRQSAAERSAAEHS